MQKCIAFGLAFVMLAPSLGIAAGDDVRNPFTAAYCARPAQERTLDCRQAREGDTWHGLFPDAVRRFVAYNLNRQNEPLKEGQWVIEVPRGFDYMALSPLPREGYGQFAKVIVFSPMKRAWGLYVDGELLTWGAAVGGAEHCKDVGRACRTPVGRHRVQRLEDGEYRSQKYPLKKGCTDEDDRSCWCEGEDCAPMPFFMSFHKAGYGFHAGPMNGANDTHGCVRTLKQHAKWLNSEHGSDYPPVLTESY